jgi:hypothetical protein
MTAGIITNMRMHKNIFFKDTMAVTDDLIVAAEQEMHTVESVVLTVRDKMWAKRQKIHLGSDVIGGRSV